MKTIAAAVLAGVLALAAVGTTSYLVGKRAGAATERADWTERERVRVAAVAEARLGDARALLALQTEVETLRARPERIKIVTKEIKVEADDDCRSLPASWLQLWNSGAGADPASGTATVDDAGLP